MKGMLKLLILKELEIEDLNGYSLLNKLESVTGKKPSCGTVYPLLNKMTEENLISFIEDKKSKIYSLTKEGKKFINTLLKEKENMIFKLAELHNVISEDQQSDVIKRMELLKDKKMFFRYFKFINDLKESVVDFLVCDNCLKNEKEFKNLLKETSKKIKLLCK